jgi:hypothetical protein
MARTEIKLCKKAVRAGAKTHATQTQAKAARTAALFLLQRSVQMKHKQLTLVRLLEALKLHAPIDEMLWQHCITVAKAIASTQELRMLYALRKQVVHGDN